jgi:hypothetical protein
MSAIPSQRPRPRIADVVDVPHDLYEAGELRRTGLPAHRVQDFVRNANYQSLDMAQEPDGTIRILTRRYVPQAASEPAPGTVRGELPVFDTEALVKAAREHVDGRAGTANWDEATKADFARTVVQQLADLAIELRGEKPGSNRLFSEYMARGGWMTEQSPEARLIGTTALAVLEVLAGDS